MCGNKYNIPKEYQLFTAVSHIRAHHNPNKEGNRNRIVIYVDQLEGGLRFSFDLFLKLFFRAYNIALSQLHPNGVSIPYYFL